MDFDMGNVAVNIGRQILGINCEQFLKKWLFFAFIMKLNHRRLKLTAKIMTERRKVERKKRELEEMKRVKEICRGYIIVLEKNAELLQYSVGYFDPATFL